jgi:hypothetical protein
VKTLREKPIALIDNLWKTGELIERNITCDVAATGFCVGIASSMLLVVRPYPFAKWSFYEIFGLLQTVIKEKHSAPIEKIQRSVYPDRGF